RHDRPSRTGRRGPGRPVAPRRTPPPTPAAPPRSSSPSRLPSLSTSRSSPDGLAAHRAATTTAAAALRAADEDCEQLADEVELGGIRGPEAGKLVGERPHGVVGIGVEPVDPGLDDRLHLVVETARVRDAGTERRT